MNMLTCTQTVAPTSVEVAGLGEVPSLLSLMWVVIFLPILCKLTSAIV